MQKTNILILIGILAIFTSCSSQNDQKAKVLLKKSKEEIQIDIDSANYYFDLVIKEHNEGIKNDILIEQYGLKIEHLETRIDQTLKKSSQLSQTAKLSKEEYEIWIKDIEINSIMKKYQLIKSWGIDFEQLTVTKHHELVQTYSDTKNNFSMKFPGNWEVMNDYQDYTLMATGPIIVDDSGKLEIKGGFGLSISPFDKKFTSYQYYEGNLKSILKAYPELKILEEKDLNLDGIPAKYVAHQCSLNNKLMTSIQVYFFKSNKGYVLNGTARSENFEKYRDLYIEIAKSFKLRK
jgi:hypothetical protein